MLTIMPCQVRKKVMEKSNEKKTITDLIADRVNNFKKLFFSQKSPVIIWKNLPQISFCIQFQRILKNSKLRKMFVFLNFIIIYMVFWEGC